jgi:outer membrane protein TolC
MEFLGGKQIANISLMQMFPWFGTLKSAKDEMSLMAKAKFESYLDSRLNLFYDVKRTWYELNKVHHEILISERNAEILRSVERLTLVRFKSGITGAVTSSGGRAPADATQNTASGSTGMSNMSQGSAGGTGVASAQGSGSMPAGTMGNQSGGSGLADLYLIQIEIADLENSIASLRNRMYTISARMNSYLNRHHLSPVSLPDSIRPEVFSFSMNSAIDSMLAANPMLNMIELEQQSLKAKSEMVTGIGYPMLGLGLNYSLISESEMSTTEMNGKDMIMPMMTITLPIYRKKYKAMKAEVEKMITASAQNYTSTANSLQVELYEAAQLLLDAQRREKLYTSQHQLADRSLSLMLKSFTASGAGLTDILRVRQQTLDYEFKKIAAVADYNTAVAWIKRLMSSTK